MNRVVISGHLANEPEYRTTQNNVSNVSFRVAVQRRFANANGVREADFLTVVAWRQTADFVRKYFHKGSFIIVDGAIQTRSYDAQDGTKRYVTEIIADQVDFGGGKSETGNAPATQAANNGNGFEEVTDDELPF